MQTDPVTWLLGTSRAVPSHALPGPPLGAGKAAVRVADRSHLREFLPVWEDKIAHTRMPNCRPDVVREGTGLGRQVSLGSLHILVAGEVPERSQGGRQNCRARAPGTEGFCAPWLCLSVPLCRLA